MVVKEQCLGCLYIWVHKWEIIQKVKIYIGVLHVWTQWIARLQFYVLNICAAEIQTHNAA